MSDWLLEHKYSIYFLLGVAILGGLALWWRSRKRHFLIAAAVAGAVLVGMLILDFSVETDGEQMVRQVREVATAISAKDLDAAFKHVSESFDRGGVNKEQFRKFCKATLDAGTVNRVQVWDESAAAVSRPSRTGEVQFRFKVHGSWGESPPNWFAKVAFTLDPDGQWRVKSFDYYDSLNQSTTPLPVPGWGGR
jgi:hypothetical protein